MRSSGNLPTKKTHEELESDGSDIIVAPPMPKAIIGPFNMHDLHQTLADSSCDA